MQRPHRRPSSGRPPSHARTRAWAIGTAAVLTITGFAAVSPSAIAAATPTPVYLDTSYTPAERAADLVSRMTVAERAQQMNSSQAPAIPRLGVAAYGWWNESNHGVNASTITANMSNATTLTNTTSYPSDLSMGSTWNKDLVYAEASMIGDEARDVSPNNLQNLDFYAPTVNLSRDPRWGRNDESWSEDPFLTADLASQYVDGLQGQDQNGNLLPAADGYHKAFATLKHYAANNSEVNRRTGSADMDQRTLREYYTAQFASIIQQSNPGSIMSAYNSVNGTPAPASVQLNLNMARQTFGFQGYFTSDCDAVYEEQAGHHWVPSNTTKAVDQYSRTAYAISAGEDLDCDAGYHDQYSYGNTVPTALSQNIATFTDTFNVGDVDTSVVRLFTARIQSGEFDAQSSVPWVAAARQRLGGVTWVSNNSNNAMTETPERLNQARLSADQSLVLLQNKPVNGSTVLPLRPPASGSYKVAVIGQFANPSALFLGGYSAIQGSAGVANEVNPYQGIKSAVQAIDPDATVDYYKGFTGTGTSASQLTAVDPAAVAAAANYDAVIVVVGTDSTTGQEDHDRTTLALPGAQASLISQVAAANPRTAAYLETMGMVDATGFAGQVPALLWSSYNGQQQGLALADVVTGAVNPSGRLPMTWYGDASQLPAVTDYSIRPNGGSDPNGRTYMYFTGTVAWPLGYGLSYTDFSYANTHVDKTAATADDSFTVTADVTNTGSAAGQVVPQLYVSTPFEPASAQRPAKRLEGFTKLSLNPGQTKQVSFTVPASQLAFFDQDNTNTFVVDPGTYGLQVSSSAADADIKGQTSIAISGALTEKPAVLTAQPVQAGDPAQNIAQRVMFDVNRTIVPQLTVSMTNQKLYGYITKGQSTALPAGATVTYSSDRPSVVAVASDQTLTTVGSGVATVTATLTDNGVSVSTGFVVDVAPLAITSNPSAVFAQGTAGTYPVTTAGSTTASLTESGALPAGLTFTDNGDGTATLAGTTNDPTGNYPITITAHNGVAPDAVQSFTLQVGTPSVITSGSSTVFSSGVARSTTITTTGFPTATITESGTLPAGLTFTDNKDGTATLAGTTTAVGTYPVTVKATNGLGTAASQGYTISVQSGGNPTSGVLSGKVTSNGSSGLANICVYAYPAGQSAAAAYATCTTSSGNYEFDNVTPGDYNVAFADPAGARVTQWYNGTAAGAANQAGSSTVTVPAGGPVGGINATMAASTLGNVTGKVTGGSGAALANMCVYLYPTGTSSAAAYATCTGTDGTYRISGVTAGNYNIAFTDPAAGYVTQWYTGSAAGAATQAGAKSNTVPGSNGTLANINATLAAVPSGGISGTVTDSAGGGGLGNECVYLYAAGNTTAAAYATCTAADGSYHLTGVTAGGYTVAFADPTSGHVTQWYNGTGTGAATQAGATPVAVPNGNGTAAGVNAAMVAVGTGQVTGSVTDAASGANLGNVCVYLYRHGDPSSAAFAGCTAAGGGYTLSGVTAGQYDVAFYDPAGVHATQWYDGTPAGAGTQSGATPVTVPNGNGTAAGINAALALVAQGTLAGTVTDAVSGTPLANICVYLYQAGTSTSAAYATCTAANGTYAISGAASGSYNVAFADPASGYTTQWYSGAAGQASAQVVTVPAGNATVAGINAALVPVQTGNVSGTVTGPSGQPVANVCVYLYTAAGTSSTASSCTAANGTYTIPGVPRGNYQVAFYDPGFAYRTQWYTGAAGGSADRAGAVSITVPPSNATVGGINAAMAAR